MLSKSFIQFSVDGRVCVLSLLFDLRPNYGGGNEDNGDLLQKVPCTHCLLSVPDPAAGHCQPMPLPETPRHSWASLGQPLVASLLLLLGVYKFLLIKYQREYNKNVIFLLRKWRQECIMCRYGTKSGVTITGVPGASARSPCDLPPSPTLLYLLQVWDGVVPHPGPHTPVSSLSRWAHS